VASITGTVNSPSLKLGVAIQTGQGTAPRNGRYRSKT
jgi:hypothetical protein